MDFSFDTASAWYSGTAGQVVSLIAFVLLGVGCFLLAKIGAKWDLDDAAAGEAEAKGEEK